MACRNNCRRAPTQYRSNPDRLPNFVSGIDSMQVVSILAGLEDRLGFRFQSNPLEDHATIESLSQFAANRGIESGSAEQ